jgi:hypothetical protein
MSASDAKRLRRPGPGGQALVEFVLVLPILLFLALGVIEFARALDVTHSMTSLSREGANLAARGTPLDTVANTVITNGTDIGLPGAGGVIATEVEIQSGWPIVQAQAYSAGFARPSAMGGVGDTAFVLNSLGLLEGRRHYVVEIFYRHRSITPLRGLFGLAVRDTLYDRAVF